MYYKIVETYPEAVVQRIFIVDAPNEEEAVKNRELYTVHERLIVHDGDYSVTDDVTVCDAKSLKSELDKT